MMGQVSEYAFRIHYVGAIPFIDIKFGDKARF